MDLCDPLRPYQEYLQAFGEQICQQHLAFLAAGV